MRAEKGVKMNSSVTLTSQEASVVAAGFMMLLAVFAVYVVLLIIARWRIFTKAGEKGWKSIIPIYSDYVQWKIAWNKTGLFWVALLLVVAGYIVGYSCGLFVTNSSGEIVTTGSGGMMGIVSIVLFAAGGILNLVAAYKLFVSFGHGAGWFVGYIFLSSIMLLILGLGSSQYRGPQD